MACHVENPGTRNTGVPKANSSLFVEHALVQWLALARLWQSLEPIAQDPRTINNQVKVLDHNSFTYEIMKIQITLVIQQAHHSSLIYFTEGGKGCFCELTMNCQYFNKRTVNKYPLLTYDLLHSLIFHNYYQWQKNLVLNLKSTMICQWLTRLTWQDCCFAFYQMQSTPTPPPYHPINLQKYTGPHIACIARTWVSFGHTSNLKNTGCTWARSWSGKRGPDVCDELLACGLYYYLCA